MSTAPSRAEFVALAFGMSETVNRFMAKASAYFYLVALSGHACPTCAGRLEMIGESRCRCAGCGAVFDPTVTFQLCPACGGKPRLRIRRYECSVCGADLPSRFVFDGLIFDAEYFRQKMAEHRQRKHELQERVRKMLAGTRSGAVVPGPLDFGAVPGLVEALNKLTAGNDVSLDWQPRGNFDLARYETHIQACLGTDEMAFDDIPSLAEDRRLDRVWRFIAIIFLAHAGLVQVWQEGNTIMVMQGEIDREGCELSGDLEEPDGVEGSPG